jgi:hypothetical protein
MARDYVTYDEIEDVLTSTDLLALVTPQLSKQPAYWKWAIIAAQNGLQGAIVCALHDSIGISALTDKSRRVVLKWLESGQGKEPPKRLADFWTLFWRYCRENPTAKEKVTRRQVRDIRRLHREFRNSFEHFIPETWSIEKAGLPRIVGTAIDFIEIVMQHDKVVSRLTGNKITRLKGNIAAARIELEGLRSTTR